jgi:hypothetical protein
MVAVRVVAVVVKEGERERERGGGAMVGEGCVVLETWESGGAVGAVKGRKRRCRRVTLWKPALVRRDSWRKAQGTHVGLVGPLKTRARVGER